MRKPKKITQDFYLIGSSLLVAFLVTLSQLNIQEFIRVDRLKHIMITGSLCLLLFLFQDIKSRGVLPIIFLIFGLGFLKEFTDPQFDGMDIVANTIGFLLAMASYFFFTQIQVKRI